MKVLLIFFTLIINLACIAGTKFKLNDFAIDLESITSGKSHIWVNSGYTTVNPECLSVFGVNEFYSPPFAAKNFRMRINLKVDSILLNDDDAVRGYGKGDVGLLYSGGTWYPHKIVRLGTYHHLKNGRLVSLGVTSELIPLFGQSGFIEKVSVINRTNHLMQVEVTSDLEPGTPSVISLDKWGYGIPRANASEAVETSANSWSNDKTSIRLFQENTQFEILPGETQVSFFTVLIGSFYKDYQVNAKELEITATQAWEKRLATYTKNIPSLESNIEGLSDYYKRSVISGLVCIWENPNYTPNPFFSESGMDGGGICTYPWGIAYQPYMATLMLDSAFIDIVKTIDNMDLKKHNSYTPKGTGIGVKYSYDRWSFITLVSSIFKFLGPSQELFTSAKTLFLSEEEEKSQNNLIDYGVQNNLLEMRGAGYEHYVVSPNAERIWCFNQLAEMGKILNVDEKELNKWNNDAEVIKNAIQKELWDNNVKWVASIYPDGFKDFVYTIQVYDALRAGVCTPEMEVELISHLRDGAFLSEYGITSVSKEDSIHYEVLDTDWSGGGAYTGDGPQLALIMYERNRPEVAWNILKRHFWMGKHLLYYPQEHFSDKPMVPSHKRANVVSGLAGAEAILFGLIGFQPQMDGGLRINPQPPEKGEITIKDFGFRNNKFDITLSKDKIRIFKNNSLIYEGEPKTIKILQAKR